MKYDHHGIEEKWQERWSASKVHEARDGDARPKEYLLVEFPYPSGDGLHVGHIRPYVALDIIARKRRMEGRNVLYPFGWDAFGLPTENYAIKMGIHPRVATERNVATFKRQIQALGISFDWSREVNTTDPAYYKWTQWIFLKLLEHGLAYKARIPINWCTRCKIGLANEEVVGGACERCGGPVEKRDREQWMLKITAYAEKLLAGLEHVDYIERAKVQQVNWIGRSEGARIEFKMQNAECKIEVFTTRPDTLFGATYLVLAPEYPLVEQLLSTSSSRPSPSSSRAKREISQDGEEIPILENPDEVHAYIEQARKRTEIERTAEEKESAQGGSASGGKTGVELKGIRAVNPANGEEIPVWVADYVLAHYGTGAIMAVPAHDERDFAFARKYDLRVKPVVMPPDEWFQGFITQMEKEMKGEYSPTIEFVQKRYLADPTDFPAAFEDHGPLINSGQFSGMSSEEAKRAITEHVGGKMTVTYKLRDWVFSRQRYWGEPIPVVFCAGCAKGQPGSEEVRVQSEESNGKSGNRNASLITHHSSLITLINGVPHAIVPVPEDQLPVLLPEVERYQPTDTGDSPLAAITEWVNTTCPKCGGPAKRETDVMPNWAGSSWYYLAYAMRGNSKSETRNPKLDWDKTKLAYWMPVDWYNGGMEHTTLHLLYSRFWNIFLHDIGVVPVAEPYAKRTSHGLILASDGEKMSKSRGNVVNPDEIVERFGADAVRLYEMFIGPFDQPVPWSTDGLVGCRRFLEKVVTLAERCSGDLQPAPAVASGVATETDGGLKASATESDALTRLLHRTIKKVTDDIEAMRFNTAVSCLMEFANALGKRETVPSEVFGTFLRLLAPFAPHLTEELWRNVAATFSLPRPQRRGSPHGGLKASATEGGGIFNYPWPSYDPAFIVENEIDLVVQVNGKVRATIRVPADIAEADARARALAEPNVAKYVGEKQLVKVIFVPKRLINIVV